MRLIPELTIGLCLCGPAQGQNVDHLYTATQLQQAYSAYSGNLIGLWQEDLLSQISPVERRRAGTVTLKLPLTGINRSPLEFYSSATSREVFLPVASVKFMDDVSVALAWRFRRGCDVGAVTDYAAALRYQPGTLRGPPLAAMGVPENAWDDLQVRVLAQNILKSTVFFVAGHEYAHVLYRHRGSGTVTAQRSQEQESEADEFALELMRRIGVAPLGVTYYFMIASRLEATPGDFNSLVEYERYLQARATHPMSARRIIRIATAIEAAVDDFTRLEPSPARAKAGLLAASAQLREIGAGLDDRKMREFLAQRARTLDVASLRRSCRRR